jgi:hypothetical protein
MHLRTLFWLTVYSNHPRKNQYSKQTFLNGARHTGNRNNATGTAKGYVFDGRAINVRVPAEIRYFYPHRHTGSGAHSASYTMDTRDSSLGGVKPPGNEANHSPETSGEVKSTRIDLSTPPYVFLA